MEQLYRVAVHYKNDNGFIEYDPASRKLNVLLQEEVTRSEVEKFLTTEHWINAPQNTTKDFSRRLVCPVESLSNLKLGLTRLWQNTGVHVDWSRPV